MFPFAGSNGHWIVDTFTTGLRGWLQTAEAGRENLLNSSWQYVNSVWYDDSTLGVAGNHIFSENICIRMHDMVAMVSIP